VAVHGDLVILPGVFGIYQASRLERLCAVEQAAESAWLELEPADGTDALPQILDSSVSYRIAVAPHQGQKAFMIGTIRPLDRPDSGLERVAKANGFSLHAGVVTGRAEGVMPAFAWKWSKWVCYAR